MKTTINGKNYTITTSKMPKGMGGFMACSQQGLSGVKGFGATRSRAITDLRNQIKNPN